jgi:hypothetical protein
VHNTTASLLQFCFLVNVFFPSSFFISLSFSLTPFPMLYLRHDQHRTTNIWSIDHPNMKQKRGSSKSTKIRGRCSAGSTTRTPFLFQMQTVTPFLCTKRREAATRSPNLSKCGHRACTHHGAVAHIAPGKSDVAAARLNWTRTSANAYSKTGPMGVLLKILNRIIGSSGKN